MAFGITLSSQKKDKTQQKNDLPECCVSLSTMLGPELTFSDFQFVHYYFAMNC